LCWSTIAGLAVLHIGGVAGAIWIVLRPSLPTVLLAVIFYVLCGLSVTAGYHRLFAHRTYRAAAPVRWFLLIFGAASFQNSALSWCADHRAHHADTDGAGDPHAITGGIWYSHVGWLLRRRASSADVTRLSDLWAVRSIRLQHRFCLPVALAVGLLLPALIATLWGDPWGGLLVAGFLRTMIVLQATFCVNSLAHLVGVARYDPRSSARDSALVALITFGEGYHSFHHRFPFDYRNGARWWQYDPSKWLIWSLSRLRLATGRRAVSASTVARTLAKADNAVRTAKRPHRPATLTSRSAQEPA
jgi:stearoyl-CoA desaturase (delta-9 desaturase)